jgi:N-methylhydantoinase A
LTAGAPDAADAAERYRLGVDIGGTFTDLVLIDATTGAVTLWKTLTTLERPADGVMAGVQEILATAEASGPDLRHVLHATTLATNALIERRGSRTALLTTDGFRDVLEMANEGRYDLYDLDLELPSPLIPRHLRFEIVERILADGSIHVPLDEQQVDDIIGQLRVNGVETVAVSLLHSYRNPEHERRLRVMLEERLKGVRVSLSSDVAPEIREYPRTSTTAANAYLSEVVEGYLHELQRQLSALGLRGRLLVMMSSGGLCTVEAAARFPVRLIESGPAAGALVAAYLGSASGRQNLLSFDMGGTTAKACVIEAGQPNRTDDFEVDRVWRFKKGSGLPIKAPVIELVEIGAGGGSIAWIDQLGMLRVGPASAGANPGPACYGRNGVQPTVTDADLVLGYLDPTYFLGGSMRLDIEAARQAIQTHVADPLGIDVIRAAWGIHQVVNENMAGAAQIAATEHGRNPSDYPVFAFGGAGPVHAFGIAKILGAGELVVPMAAGVASALGLLCAPMSFDFVHSWLGRLDVTDWDAVMVLFTDMERAGRSIMHETGTAAEEVRIYRSADARFLGQSSELNIPIPAGVLGMTTAGAIEQAFHEAYRRRYGRTLVEAPVEVVNWRCVISGALPELPALHLAGASGQVGDARSGPRKGERYAYFEPFGDFVLTPVYDRYQLDTGFAATGPAIIEERESTTVVGSGAAMTIDAARNILVRIRP